MTETAAVINLGAQQLQAYSSIDRFLVSDRRSPFFVLKGYAGTGKTFLLGELERTLGSQISFVYTAPTNKATKVLSGTFRGNASCRTIYSLLGIKMVQNDDRLQLEFPKRAANLSVFDCIVVDESSMLPTILLDYIVEIVRDRRVKFIFVGDPAQLQPVGESISPVWKLDVDNDHTFELTDVMRYDNELLELATHIRKLIQRFPRGRLHLHSNHSDLEGVWKYRHRAWERNVKRAAANGLFLQPDHTKVLAWRNKTVKEMNELVRQEQFGRESRNQWIVGDRVMVAEPVQAGSHIIANIDDEGTVVERDIGRHALYKELDVYHLTVQLDDERAIRITVPHERSEVQLQTMLSNMAAEARRDTTKWRNFWGLYNSVHRIRYGYASTAHRAQGSSYENAFVNTVDILSNSNTLEALKCLYVTSTRPRKRLILL